MWLALDLVTNVKPTLQLSFFSKADCGTTYEKNVAEFLATNLRVCDVWFYWFDSGGLKYRIFTDFLQIGKMILKNFVRFSMLLF